jgi:hypothetical protein
MPKQSLIYIDDKDDQHACPFEGKDGKITLRLVYIV